MNLSSLIYLENSTIRYPLYLVQDEASRIPCSNLFHGIEPVLGRILGIAAVFIAVEEVHRPGIIAKFRTDEKGFPGMARTKRKKERLFGMSAIRVIMMQECKAFCGDVKYYIAGRQTHSYPDDEADAGH